MATTSAFRDQGLRHNLSLPHGRHHLSRELVRASQRGRILDAMADVVSEKGYAAATVGDVTARAGVSRKTFYEQFEDKQSCFLAGFDAGVAVLVSHLREKTAGQRGWYDRLRIGLEAFFKLLSEEPAFTRCLAIDAFAAGEVARQRRAALVAGFAEVYRRTNAEARAQDASIVELDLEVCRAIAGGVDEALRGYVEAGRIEELPSLVPVMLEWVTSNVARRADGAPAAPAATGA
jgi:AcrR family transcriptional regulator